LMDQAARDLGTRLDWVAVDHWNTEHPHIHILVRGRAGSSTARPVRGTPSPERETSQDQYWTFQLHAPSALEELSERCADARRTNSAKAEPGLQR
jgi:hypothetical protein